MTVVVDKCWGLGSVYSTWKVLQERMGREGDALIDVNARFTMQLTRAMLLTLLRNAPGLVVNVVSVTAELPATFRECLRRGQGIHSSMESELDGRDGGGGRGYRGPRDKGTGFFMPMTRKMAAAALDAVGLLRTGRMHCN